MGDEQSLSVRIVHVADVYDALTSRRPYKKPYSPYEAVEYLMGACGIMFDKKRCGSVYGTCPTVSERDGGKPVGRT